LSSRPIARLEEDEGRNAGRIRLYVARGTPNSARAEQNLLAALRNGANSDFSQRLEIIDIRKAPEQSLSDGVFLTPTLVCFKRSGQLTMTGDLADREKLNLLLQSLRDDETTEKMEALIAGKEKMLEERVALAAELNHRARNNLKHVSQLLAEHLEHESGCRRGRRSMPSFAMSWRWPRCTTSCWAPAWPA
jgi:two-component sensor histidine kinase